GPRLRLRRQITMVEIELDGKKVEVLEGSMVMHAAEKAGTYIPHFCYHKKLSIAANCRMCLVDVEKAPKPMPACATPVTQGMVVKTKTDKAIKAQQSVMEFLLINHPLDCPICDQGGECQLQDLAVGYGGSGSRYEEEKRVVFHKDVGPLITFTAHVAFASVKKLPASWSWACHTAVSMPKLKPSWANRLTRNSPAT
ncbi:MAG: NADH-quinone oxidoreductase chain 3, partial [Pseudomonadota bacterium]